MHIIGYSYCKPYRYLIMLQRDYIEIVYSIMFIIIIALKSIQTLFRQ